MAHIEIYTTNVCPYCKRAKALFAEKGVSFDEYDVTTDSAKRTEMIKRSGGRTVPQIFIDDKHIGGCDDLVALNSAGKLDPLLGK
ncbi:MAG: glutaredoxin 3 [Zymomonas mobilis subsp. pomaceae]|uniref:Glutaredoxin n=1 Tax=Zymomonas mobilis subsp. pomaceae (strain ATCC 29192 / DSM 22645 / JCM 10191 / CCUG 17912 / NBRC 13757 / NCIMB 11200 / NRRL B-4491 / Barker I) TaxID=579138 RepID=F8EVR7_ZYMMT|nr:glutaredoxin 3 [Zymomonas mobilis]AEI37394.1 glutaredoxin 3 [Zymomonas mobilis subsp. pomaceae ATCC 29192]MDX5948762.1 glutaredoxin 3 [Zymomonas mobilis subsp. pomaceae]GEB88566.1 glutaredoxin 3 [Zymomonas mobilis subsp. pomaceae]